MEDLYKKIEQLCSLIKKVKGQAAPKSTLPSVPPIKPISPPSMTAKPSVAQSKIPGHNPSTKKDPKKVAEQLKNANVQKLKAPLLKIDDNGQWSLEPGE